MRVGAAMSSTELGPPGGKWGGAVDGGFIKGMTGGRCKDMGHARHGVLPASIATIQDTCGQSHPQHINLPPVIVLNMNIFTVQIIFS